MTDQQRQKPDIERREHAGLKYVRHASDRGKLERGTVCLLDHAGETIRQLPTYPHINRVYRLAEGVQRLFGDEAFLVEEKIDGYNVRIFQHDGQLLAATRGGYICPFTTEWAKLWDEHYGLREFFTDYPQHVLCVEVCGDNPYHCQRDPELPPGAHMMVFDVMTPEGSFLPLTERRELIEHHAIPAVPFFGSFTIREIDQLYEVLRQLHERRREGIVFRSASGDRVLKFVTPSSDLWDIEQGLLHQFELHQGFFRHRFLRSALFVHELGLDKQEYARRLGEAFRKGFEPLECFREASESGVAYVGRQQTWDAMQQIIGGEVHLVADRIEPTTLNGRRMLQVQFRRIYQKSTDRYRTILKGFPHTD